MDKETKNNLIFSFSLIGQIGFATALPLVVFASAGRYFDGKFNSSPYFLLTGIAFASIIIYFYLRNIINKALVEIEKYNS